MRVTEGWAGDGNVKTRVINLGRVEWDFPPTITVIHNSSQPWGASVNLYLDNLRLINTGGGASVPDSFEITDVTQTEEGAVQISWTSVEGAEYAVDSSGDLQDWQEVDDGVPSGGEITTFTLPATEDAEEYYRVKQLEQQ